MQDKPKLVLHLEDKKTYETIKLNRMTHAIFNKIGYAFVNPENEKLRGSPTCIAVKFASTNVIVTRKYYFYWKFSGTC